MTAEIRRGYWEDEPRVHESRNREAIRRLLLDSRSDKCGRGTSRLLARGLRGECQAQLFSCVVRGDHDLATALPGIGPESLLFRHNVHITDSVLFHQLGHCLA